MPTIERPVLFIDANQYLSLFELAVAGKTLLDNLEEQKDYIFVSMQLMDEVLRNKLRCAGAYFTEQLAELGKIKAAVPDHLLGISDEKVSEFRKAFDEATQQRNELAKLTAEALARISRSDDDVSKRLSVLFSGATEPTDDEMRRARERKERGKPPGKRNDPLGDQITWEQLMSHCKVKECKGLWIITSDSDYFTKYQGKCLLNPLLRANVIDACGKSVEVHCFDNLLKGIKEFGKNAGVKADRLPTGAQEIEIEKEIDALPPRNWNAELPPIGWLMSSDDSWMVAAATAAAQRRFRAAIAGSEGSSFLDYPPPAKK
jgi:PIN domain